VPVAELAELDASGLLGITVPREHDGPDLAATVLAEVIRWIAVVEPATAQVPQAHFLFVDGLAVWGRPEQHRRLFASVLSGGRLGNGLAERGRRHAQDLKTRLVSGSGGLRLRGPQVLLHRGDHGPLDRRQRARRRRAPGPAAR
jgi:alkylation response protein AidB-like acyl-CoA dehydrogenase